MPSPQLEIFARRGSRVTDEQAKRHHEQALKLPKEERTAENYLELCSDPDSPVHGDYTWDDSVAGHQWRLQEARHFLKSVHVRVTEDSNIREAPVFFSARVTEDHSRTMSYVSFSEANEDERLADQILSRALRDLRAWRDRYAEHADILEAHSGALPEILRLADETLED